MTPNPPAPRPQGEADLRIVDLITEQIETASVLIVNNAPLVSLHQQEQMGSFLHHLNPDASVLFTDATGSVPLGSVLGSGTFKPDMRPG